MKTSINKRVGAIMKNPPGPIKKHIRQEVSKEICDVIPKKSKLSIKGVQPSHNEPVRQAEHIIYSGANFYTEWTKKTINKSQTTAWLGNNPRIHGHTQASRRENREERIVKPKITPCKEKEIT